MRQQGTKKDQKYGLQMGTIVVGCRYRGKEVVHINESSHGTSEVAGR